MAGIVAIASTSTADTLVSPADSRIGLAIEELDTPTLLLDRAASDRNLAKMALFFANRPSKLRPHFKNHKCVTLAKRQLAAGAADHQPDHPMRMVAGEHLGDAPAPGMTRDDDPLDLQMV